MTRERPPYLTCALLGLGGLFAGVTGPLLSAYVPVLAERALGTHRFAIGAVMALDNVLLLLMVPWAGARSDRAAARGRGRLALGVAGLLLASVGMAALPFALSFGLFGLLAALVLLYTGINVQRAPLQALVADLVPTGARGGAPAGREAPRTKRP